ncbi:MAG: hypothetical protein DRP87_02000 [Spirochaetes bacterium]|nr:MAG: hypothetical protein DRP87_02000 [Spirochaetota bacterium]
MDRIGIGIAGYGMIGKIHAMNYTRLPFLYPGKLPRIELAAVCTSRTETASEAADYAGFSAWFTDIKEMVHDERVDVIDCCLPNFLHKQILLEAFTAGKPVLCEKPLALNGEEARLLAEKAKEAGVKAGITFNYRFVPAIMLARKLIAEKRALGEVYSFRVEYLHSGYQDPNRPMSWKLRKEQAGGGALVDLGSHLIDLVRYLLGEYESVRASVKTYIKERPVKKGVDEKELVTVDDAVWLEVRLKNNGAIGTVEASRFATGSLDDLNIEMYGSKGAIRFSLMDANRLYFYDAGKGRGWEGVQTVQDYPGASLPPSRSILGWPRTHAENQYRFLRAILKGCNPEPDITDGVYTQIVMDTAYRSAESGGWEKVLYTSP